MMTFCTFLPVNPLPTSGSPQTPWYCCDWDVGVDNADGKGVYQYGMQ